MEIVSGVTRSIVVHTSISVVFRAICWLALEHSNVAAHLSNAVLVDRLNTSERNYRFS